MLNLQRASAGSGKTYSLARTYLKLLLGVNRGNGTYRLREPAETGDAHSRLLAITFTNKATAEMRRRFIEKLAALADPTTCADADYMADFREEFATDTDRIQRIAAYTLSAILNHYSDFQVSTIDSFFQQILHSFTYEAELPEGYAVELDTEMVIAAALDSLFAEAQANPHSSVHYWLSIYMSRRQSDGKKWNLSQRQGKGSAYTDLFGYLKMIDKEDFKQQRMALEHFFKTTGDLRGLYNEVQRIGDSYVEEKHKEALKHMTTLLNACDDCGVRNHLSKNLLNRFEKMQGSIPDRYPFDVRKELLPLKSILLKSALNVIGEGTAAALKEMEEKWVNTVCRWFASTNYVKMVADAIPVMALIKHLLTHIEAYRTDNNIVQLSDTNTILRTITEGSDVPFIYEKIGTELHSFMIDEFQDTSAMQWSNMRPLMEQSLGEGHENLIIGDAKQSIYRFRNADSTLITSQLPKEFGGPQLRVLGATPQENANWRSAPEVVLFNNTLFSYLSTVNSNDSSANEIPTTYAGVLQQPRKEKLKGYVEISNVNTNDAEITADYGSEEASIDMSYLGPTISDMLQRGYCRKDIAILVRRHKDARAAVRSLVEYNTLHRENTDFTPIEFISDEALLVSRARSVEITVAMLRAVKDEVLFKEKNEDAGQEIAEASYTHFTSDLEIGLNRLRADNPHTDTSDLINLYIAGKKPAEHARVLLAQTKSTALPALVENIIAIYVPESLRQSEAQYICAFQDAVVNFCYSHANDITSFLHWWDEKKSSLSVVSPEDADAVNILTIHKSKGLEWRCVIVADCNFPLNVGSGEQAWLKPAEPFQEAVPLLPVSLGSRKQFMYTPYEREYLAVEAQTRLDAMNLAYVAFTRAVDELYIFLADGRKSTPSIAGAIKSMIKTGVNAFCAPEDAASSLFVNIDNLVLADKDEVDNGKTVLTYGCKPTAAYVQQRNTDLAPEQDTSVYAMRGYKVNVSGGMPQYAISDTLPATDAEGSADFRRLGSVKHAVLEGIRQGEDVNKEVDRMLQRCLVRGSLSRREAAEVRAQLVEALGTPEVKLWFGKDMKVYAERTIFDATCRESYRPDRVVADAAGCATVIDYKFGARHASHRKQVARYMMLLRATGLFASVKGVVWYVSERKVVEV